MLRKGQKIERQRDDQTDSDILATGRYIKILLEILPRIQFFGFSFFAIQFQGSRLSRSAMAAQAITPELADFGQHRQWVC